ncbi:MAG: glycosyltransferase [Candidatus Latescibacteria bacterium]|nr:glycosyltransferase [Candidatus Latescibacterota bacterium]
MLVLSTRALYFLALPCCGTRYPAPIFSLLLESRPPRSFPWLESFMKYLFTGGGTGGHVYPALAIADEIRNQQEDAEFLYVGLKSKIEARVAPERGYPIRFVYSRPFPGYLSIWPLLRFGLSLGMGICKAILILLWFRPHIIVGTGGYVSAPILLAYGLLARVGLSRAKVFLYEPNARPGLLNRVVGRLGHRIGVAFEQAARWFDMKRVGVVGHPVRRQVIDVDRCQGRQTLGIEPEKKVVLVFGGSGGARTINEAIVEALPQLRQRADILVLHVTGRYRGTDYRAVDDTAQQLRQLGLDGDTADWYWRRDYMDDLHLAYGAADLVVCRGGAATLMEICACGLPALIAPLSGQTDDHQVANARRMEACGAARVLYQGVRWINGDIKPCLDSDNLARQILDLLADEPQRLAMGRIARAQPTLDSLELIKVELANLAAGLRPPPLNLDFPEPEEQLPEDPNALFRWVQKRLDEKDQGRQVTDPEWAYLQYQADRLLASTAWYEIPLGARNVGVKLAGCLQYRARLPLLLEVLQDRRPLGAWQRLWGGDYRHGGILRRNVVEFGLRFMGVADEPVEAALIRALAEDPYFEVRAAAARILGEQHAGSGAAEEALVKALDDRSGRVGIEAVKALGRIGQDPDLRNYLSRFYLHHNWQFRHAVVGALQGLLDRQVVAPEAIAADLEQILATSPYFKPEFPLKESLQALAERLRP